METEGPGAPQSVGLSTRMAAQPPGWGVGGIIQLTENQGWRPCSGASPLIWAESLLSWSASLQGKACLG